MAEKIALCGDDCLSCPRYNAHTEEELRNIAQLWHKLGWRDRVVSDEEIACAGCSSHKSCTYGLVECTGRHGVQKCNQCAEYPCGRISEMLRRSAEYREKCRALCTEQEYTALCKAFFNKESNLNK